MSAVLSLSEPHVDQALARFALDDITRYWRAAHGIENSNYFVQCRSHGRIREYVLTIVEQAASAGDAYVPMMQSLYDGGLPVAPPLPSRAGRLVEEVDGKSALLQHRLRGQHTLNPTNAQIRSLARFMARMHLATETAQVQAPAYPRDQAWLNAQAQRVIPALPYADRSLLEGTLIRTASLLARSDARSLPRGVIHGDLFRDNVLFDERSLTGVLDFHHAATGYWIYDLAVAANDWCNDATGLLDPDRTTSLLRAYHAIRPLKEGEIWFFSAFALYAAAAFWLSRLVGNLDAGTTGGRTKNPDEFKRIVQHHSRHYFYLDPRRLD